MSVVANFQPIERVEDSRQEVRLQLSLGTTLKDCGTEIVIQDISSTGLRFETNAVLAPGDVIEVRLPEMEVASATVVWRRGRACSGKFTSPIPKAAVSAALLRSEPLSRSGQEAARVQEDYRIRQTLRGTDDGNCQLEPTTKSRGIAGRLTAVFGVGAAVYLAFTAGSALLVAAAIFSVILLVMMSAGDSGYRTIRYRNDWGNSSDCA